MKNRNPFISKTLEKYGSNLTSKAQRNEFDPVLHRELEIRNVLEVLCRKNKSNPVLVGKPGVGKTAIVEEIAKILLSDDMPNVLKGKVIYSLQMSNLVAGTSYRGEFEERLNQILDEVLESKKMIILFIDEIHNIIGTGSASGSLDVANILKPAISRGEIQLIGATTDEEYNKLIRSDKAFERRCQLVPVIEPDVETAVYMLNGLKERYESHHELLIGREAMVTAVQLSDQYITDRYLPDKALDLIDLAAAQIRLDQQSKPMQLIGLELKVSRNELNLSMLNSTVPDEIAKRKDIARKIHELRLKIAAYKEKWSQEIQVIKQEKKFKRLINTYKKEARETARIGYNSKSKEIMESLIPNLEKKMADLKSTLDLDNLLIYKEELTPKDVIRTFQKYYPNVDISDYTKESNLSMTLHSNLL